MQNLLNAVEVNIDFNAMSQAINDIKKDSKTVIKEVEVILFNEEMEACYE